MKEGNEMGRRIVIELETDRFSIRTEIPANPSPLELRTKECFSKTELLRAVNELAVIWPELTDYPPKSIRKIRPDKLKTGGSNNDQTKSTIAKSITGL